jgi:hypothetical protein
MMPFKVICIDDKHKPNEVPDEAWIMYGERYTVVAVDLLSSHNKIGFKLQEIILPEKAFPYEYFDSQRFILSNEDEELLIEAEFEKLLHETGNKVQKD